MAYKQYRQGSTYFGYDPDTQSGIAFPSQPDSLKYFPSLDANAPAPDFDYSQLMSAPGQLLSLAKPQAPQATPQTPMAPAAPVQAQQPTMPQMPTYAPKPYTPPNIDTSQLKNLETQFQTLLSPTAEETQTQQQLDNLITSREMGLNKIENQPIPLDLLIGQGNTLMKQAATQALPLQQRLALAQAKRQASLDASKFSLEREENRINQMREEAQYGFEQDQQNQLNQYNAGLKGFEYQQQLTKELEAKQLSAKDFALKNKITKPFYEVAGAVYRTSDGKPYSSKEEAARDGVDINGWSNVQPIAPDSAIDLSKYPASYQEYLLAKKEGFNGTYNDYQTMDANRKRSITNNTTTNILNDATKEFDLRVKQAPSQVAQLKNQGKSWSDIAAYFNELGIDPGISEIDDALHRAFQSQKDYNEWKSKQ